MPNIKNPSKKQAKKIAKKEIAEEAKIVETTEETEGEKKVEEKKEEKVETKEEAAKKEKQAMIFIACFVLLIVFVLAFYFWSTRGGKFEYAGLEFSRVMEGKLMFYYTKFPLMDLSGKVAGELPFYFRNDPRKLSYVKINNTIVVSRNVYLISDKSIDKCEDSGLAILTLSMFLGRSGFKPAGGTTDKEFVTEKLTFVDCNNLSQKSAVILEEGNVSQISKQGRCYVLEASNCALMDVSERFIIGLYADSKNIKLP